MKEKSELSHSLVQMRFRKGPGMVPYLRKRAVSPTVTSPFKSYPLALRIPTYNLTAFSSLYLTAQFGASHNAANPLIMAEAPFSLSYPLTLRTQNIILQNSKYLQLKAIVFISLGSGLNKTKQQL